MAAADVRDFGAALELLLHPLEGRDPLLDEEGGIAAAEEPLDAAEQALMVLVPADAVAGAEGRGDLRLVEIGRGDHVEGAGDVDRAGLVARAIACSAVMENRRDAGS